ncbi:hypothetical protein BGZ60DRAFT_517451 [Tricladium varicosporioides]|nr:hypothetical protein BGZ60DRAFT_517451 [Hymenoscyphus varicosporioides]
MATESSARAMKFVVISILLTLLSAFFVGIRLIARVVILKNGGQDEIAIVASMICAFGLLAASLAEARFGLGKHVHELEDDEIKNILKSLWVAIFFYTMSLTLTKLSIVLQYLRVFVEPRIRQACWATIWLILLYGFQATFVSAFNCYPVSGFWDFSIKSKCISKEFLWFFNASFNIFTDIVIIGLPMPVVSNLQIPAKQKVLIMAIFALGGFLYVLSRSKDLTWDNTETGMWSNIEVNIGIICASAQTIRPIITRLFPHLFLARPKAIPQTSTNATALQTFPDDSYHLQLTNTDLEARILTRIESQKAKKDKEERGSNRKWGRGRKAIGGNGVDMGDEGGGNGGGRGGIEIYVTKCVRQDVESRYKMSPLPDRNQGNLRKKKEREKYSE